MSITGFATYEQAEQYLLGTTNYETERRVPYNEASFSLQRMDKLLVGVNRPQDRLKFVHIAGTKGKGSTAAMLDAMLQAGGLRVGLYSSPHLCELTERVRVNGRQMGRTDFARHLTTLLPTIEKLRKTLPPTFFDIVTAIAMLHFAENEVDLAIMEVGLGGRLDSTNVIRPEVAVITNISYDHVRQLGPTLAHIAREKAGIIKPAVPVVVAPQPPEVTAVIEQTAAAAGAAAVYQLGRQVEHHFRCERLRHEPVSNRVSIKFAHGRFSHIPVPLMGEHQGVNCGLALVTLGLLRHRGFDLDLERCVAGLENTHWPGRMELIPGSPLHLLDGAHNAASMAALLRGISQNLTYDSMVMIFGCQRDKDIDGMFDQIKLGADKIIFTRTSNPRAADPGELSSRLLEKYGKESQVAPNLEAALRSARSAATREDLVTITGSLYLVGQARTLLGQTSKTPVAIRRAALAARTPPARPQLDDEDELVIGHGL